MDNMVSRDELMNMASLLITNNFDRYDGSTWRYEYISGLLEMARFLDCLSLDDYNHFKAILHGGESDE